jgi:AICAR transformylase/IMP cyclohydrolase PurH
MTRSAAKAGLLYDSVCIVTSKNQYPELIRELEENQGAITTKLRRKYALEAFKKTRDYERTIVSFLEEKL